MLNRSGKKIDAPAGVEIIASYAWDAAKNIEIVSAIPGPHISYGLGRLKQLPLWGRTVWSALATRAHICVAPCGWLAMA